MAELVVDETRLHGIKVYTAKFGADRSEEKVCFIEDRFGRFMNVCPHCETVYWSVPGCSIGAPEACLRAMCDFRDGPGSYDAWKAKEAQST